MMHTGAPEDAPAHFWAYAGGTPDTFLCRALSGAPRNRHRHTDRNRQTGADTTKWVHSKHLCCKIKASVLIIRREKTKLTAAEVGMGGVRRGVRRIYIYIYIYAIPRDETDR